MKIISLLFVVISIHCLVGCMVTGKQKISLTFKDRHSLKPIPDMRVRLEWRDERPWRFANPNTREAYTDIHGMVTFNSLSEQYWRIKAYRPDYEMAENGFWLDSTDGISFYCESPKMIESRRLLMTRDNYLPIHSAPDMVMTAREICADGTEKNINVKILLRGAEFNLENDGGLTLKRDASYKFIELSDN